MEYFNPSLLIALNDPLLGHIFLKLCLQCYITEKMNAR